MTGLWCTRPHWIVQYVNDEGDIPPSLWDLTTLIVVKAGPVSGLIAPGPYRPLAGDLIPAATPAATLTASAMPMISPRPWRTCAPTPR